MRKPYFQEGTITLYHGDANEIVPELRERDTCITDPPYGLDFRGESWDACIPPLAFQLPKLFARTAVITGATTMFDYPRPDWVACWARPASSSRSLVGGFNHWSPVLLWGNDLKMKVDLKSLHAIQHAMPRGYGHPSPKPVALLRWLIDSIVPPGGCVVDPFCGSGSTLAAAQDLGVRAIGIEQEKRYCDLAVKRLAQLSLDL